MANLPSDYIPFGPEKRAEVLMLRDAFRNNNPPYSKKQVRFLRDRLWNLIPLGLLDGHPMVEEAILMRCFGKGQAETLAVMVAGICGFNPAAHEVVRLLKNDD